MGCLKHRILRRPMIENAFLQATAVVDWQDSQVMALAEDLAAGARSTVKIAKSCFEWVRDEIEHTADYQRAEITCCASEVLRHKTGFCYAKSHLLAALLRANQIPTGFCYQRLSIKGNGAPYCLHGFNAVFLPQVGWYRMDARGNRPGIDAQFCPPQERLAFETGPGECEFETIFAEPLPEVVEALRSDRTLESFSAHLPDRCAETEAIEPRKNLAD
jgi:transglutaminase-like putative cysteine protease